MRTPRGRTIAVASALLMLAVLVATGVSLRRRILEEYYLYLLPSLSGPEAQVLAEKLGGMGPRGRRAAEEWFLEQPEGSVQRLQVAEKLGEFGSARSIPAILTILAGIDARGGVEAVNADPRAWLALTKIYFREDAVAIEALIKALEPGKPGEQCWAARFLGGMGPLARAAVPALLEALEDPQIRVRGWAAFALREIGVEKEWFLPVLVEALPRAEGEDAAAICAALGQLGKDAASAVPVMVERFHSRLLARDVSGDFDRALAGIGVAAVEPLVGILDDQNTQVRLAAVGILGGLGEHAAPAVPALARLLGEEDGWVLVNTLQALGAIGPKAEAAVPAIAAVLRGRANSSQRVPAVIALGKIGHQARSALPSLIAVIEDPEVRGYAVEAIAEIGLEGDAAAVPKKAMAVIESLLETPPTIPPDVTRDHNPSPPESIWAACLLAQLAPELRPAFLDRLTEGLDGPHPWLQQHSARALGCLGPAARAALPRLEKAALEDEDAEVRSASAASLRRIGSPDPAPFLKALASDDETRRKRALEALAELGPTAAEAVPALISALDDDDGNLRAAAARALGCVGPEARAGIPALEVGLGDRFRSFRERCREALEKIRRP